MTDDKPTDFAIVRRWHRDSASPHLSVLRWYKTVGYARHGGTSHDLHEPPAIAGDDIEYLPGRYMIDGRPMTVDERATIRRLLVQMDSDAGDALCGTSTLAVVGGTD